MQNVRMEVLSLLELMLKKLVLILELNIMVPRLIIADSTRTRLCN